MNPTDINCLILDCTEGKENTTANELLSTICKEASTSFVGAPVFQIWKLVNKYFKADINICLCSHKHLEDINKDLYKHMEATILLFDLKKDGDFIKVQELASKLQHEALEICLLFNIGQAVDEGTNYDEVLTWTIDQNYELIQRKLTTGDDDDETVDKFEEKEGMERVLEALNSHVWSNHTRAGDDTKDEVLPEVKQNVHQDIPTDVLEGLESGQSFEKLFSKFESMKEKAETLDGVAKKDYAEKVALAFMESLGLVDDDE